MAQEVYFNTDFFPKGSEHLDLNSFNVGNVALPGDYRADVWVNGRAVGRQDIRITSQPNDQSAACFTLAQVKQLGVNQRYIKPQLSSLSDNGDSCRALGYLVDSASSSFEIQTQRLQVSIPQIAMSRQVPGYVSPESWDSGTTASMLGYNANATRNISNGEHEDRAYLGFTAGLNLGEWRLRHNGSLEWQNQTGTVYRSINSLVQRDLTTMQSQLTVGETYSSGEVFNSLTYRGVALATDDRMLPQSMRGYAPTIRGIARTSARVSVRQRSNVLMEILVAPGAFVIDDLSSVGYGNDLEVVIDEADGTQQRFVVPYSSVSQLLRPGVWRYSLTAGEVTNQNHKRPPQFFQGTLQRGLNNAITGVTGLQTSEHYTAILNGFAFNTGLGAIAVDLTHTRTQLLQGAIQGDSVRLSYSKSIALTGSQLNVGAYRFSQEGFHDLNSAVHAIESERRYTRRPSSRYSLSMNQSLGEWGQIGLSGLMQSYWNDQGRDLQYQFNFGTQIGTVGWSLDINLARSGTREMETSLLLSASMPLDLGSSNRYAQLTSRISRDSYGGLSEDVAMTNSAGEFSQYNYGIDGQRDSAGGISTSLFGQYQGSRTSLGSSLSHGDRFSSVNLSASGAVVVHPLGVTMTPHRGETVAVVSAPGAQGAGVVGYPNVKLDSRGNAVVPYLRPYQMNDVAIDPLGMSSDIELTEFSRHVAPRAGSIVAVSFGTNIGTSRIFKVHLVNGKSVPFGADVTDSTGHSMGIVGQGGQVYVRIPQGLLQLQIKWGAGTDQRCLVVLADVDDKPSPPEALCTV